MEKIATGRHWGRQTGGNGAWKNPGAPAAQWLQVGRHWVDTGERARRAAGSGGAAIVRRQRGAVHPPQENAKFLLKNCYFDYIHLPPDSGILTWYGMRRADRRAACASERFLYGEERIK